MANFNLALSSLLSSIFELQTLKPENIFDSPNVLLRYVVRVDNYGHDGDCDQIVGDQAGSPDVEPVGARYVEAKELEHFVHFADLRFGAQFVSRQQTQHER